METENKCEGCFALQLEDEDAKEMCIAPLCIKENVYDPETRTWRKKSNEFERILRIHLNNNWEYARTPLFGGKPNPETGKKEVLHTISPKTKDNIFSKLEIVDE